MATKVLCPIDETPGRRVKAFTVEHLVKPELSASVPGRDWFFCDSPTCEGVYFSADGATLSRADVTVRIGIKEKEAPHQVCYCFGHSVESIRDEIAATGASDVVASITAKVQARECSCEKLNPKGTCCLGDVRRTVQELGDGSTDSGTSCSTHCCEEASE